MNIALVILTWDLVFKQCTDLHENITRYGECSHLFEEKSAFEVELFSPRSGNQVQIAFVNSLNSCQLVILISERQNSIKCKDTLI